MATAAPNVDYSTNRVSALDGLRGVAALAVVLFHVAMLTPALATIDSGDVGEGGAFAVLAVPPLKLLWSGDEAVIVFFVLSGFVLTLPFLRKPMRPLVYYPSRLIRLYLPTWASLILAIGWYLLVPRRDIPIASWWLDAHAKPVNIRSIGGDLTLLLGTSWTNSVLWSLRWEVWFSLLFPLLLALVLRFHRFWLPIGFGLLVLIAIGQLASFDPLRFLPVFGLGMLAAARSDRLRPAIGSVSRGRGGVLLAASLLLLEASWLTGGSVRLQPLVALGATLLVVVGAYWRPASRTLSTRPLRWLGAISFSLYLVHEPVVVSVALLIGPTESLLVLPVALPVSLGLAVVMYRLVERPSHRLARRVASKGSGPAINLTTNSAISDQITGRSLTSLNARKATPSTAAAKRSVPISPTVLSRVGSTDDARPEPSPTPMPQLLMNTWYESASAPERSEYEADPTLSPSVVPTNEPTAGSTQIAAIASTQPSTMMPTLKRVRRARKASPYAKATIAMRAMLATMNVVEVETKPRKIDSPTRASGPMLRQLRNCTARDIPYAIAITDDPASAAGSEKMPRKRAIPPGAVSM